MALTDLEEFVGRIVAEGPEAFAKFLRLASMLAPDETLDDPTRALALIAAFADAPLPPQSSFVGAVSEIVSGLAKTSSRLTTNAYKLVLADVTSPLRAMELRQLLRFLVYADFVSGETIAFIAIDGLRALAKAKDNPDAIELAAEHAVALAALDGGAEAAHRALLRLQDWKLPRTLAVEAACRIIASQEPRYLGDGLIALEPLLLEDKVEPAEVAPLLVDLAERCGDRAASRALLASLDKPLVTLLTAAYGDDTPNKVWTLNQEIGQPRRLLATRSGHTTDLSSVLVSLFGPLKARDMERTLEGAAGVTPMPYIASRDDETLKANTLMAKMYMKGRNR
jgi:hypothetical protein